VGGADKAGRPAGTIVGLEDVKFLSLRDVTKTFGRVIAVDSVSLDIEEGELICFLGPSGCGKTTLLRLVAGLEEADTGQILLAGEDLARTAERDRNFGMVFQSYSLFPNMSVARNVAYGLECRKWKRDHVRARVEEMLQLVDLEDQVDKYPSQLSGGQQQRVALARALAPKPYVLLLDEPLSALDAKVRMTLRGEIRKLQQGLGITTIMVTHDQEEALTMADRVVVMHSGVIEQVGTPVEIYGDPATAFVADFIGTMNFLDARAGANGTVRLGDFELSCANWHLQPRPDQPVRLAVRPEDVRLVAEPENEPNSVTAKVEWVEFLGSTYRIDLVLGDDSGQKLKTEVSANVMREMNLSKGNRLPVVLPAELLWVYKV
jgi:iron(III) transport system ATP-binding protein